MRMNSRTIYDEIGGFSTINQLINAFYKRVARHELLTPIFPPDLSETARKQRLFLTQFFGGPRLYTLERGNPMMRRRHFPFEITPSRKNAWLSCMSAALDEVGIEEPYKSTMFDKLTMTAHHMMNTPE